MQKEKQIKAKSLLRGGTETSNVPILKKFLPNCEFLNSPFLTQTKAMSTDQNLTLVQCGPVI